MTGLRLSRGGHSGHPAGDWTPGGLTASCLKMGPDRAVSKNTVVWPGPLPSEVFPGAQRSWVSIITFNPSNTSQGRQAGGTETGLPLSQLTQQTHGPEGRRQPLLSLLPTNHVTFVDV